MCFFESDCLRIREYPLNDLPSIGHISMCQYKQIEICSAIVSIGKQRHV